MKSLGKRSRLRLTACTRMRVSTRRVRRGRCRASRAARVVRRFGCRSTIAAEQRLARRSLEALPRRRPPFAVDQAGIAQGFWIVHGWLSLFQDRSRFCGIAGKSGNPVRKIKGARLDSAARPAVSPAPTLQRSTDKWLDANIFRRPEPMPCESRRHRRERSPCRHRCVRSDPVRRGGQHRHELLPAVLVNAYTVTGPMPRRVLRRSRRAGVGQLCQTKIEMSPFAQDRDVPS